jgi:hypothetical protein
LRWTATAKALKDFDIAVQPSPLTLQIVLERIDASKNVARFYVLSVDPTLFARDTLTQRWGRKSDRSRRSPVS